MNRHKSEKPKNFLITVITLTIIVHIFCSCAPRNLPKTSSNLVSLSIRQSKWFTVEKQTFKIVYGEDIDVKLTFVDGFGLDFCDYPNYTTVVVDKNITIITFRNVRYPNFVNITAKAVEGALYYYLNGGSFIDNNSAIKGQDYFIEQYDLTHHLRANTNIGTGTIMRDGYTQTGWNTKPDGSGEHIGLGSRVTVMNDEATQLYAEWAKWLDISDFRYEEHQSGIVLTGYSGNKEINTFTIPAKIEKKEVKGIASNFVERLKGKTIILPNTLEWIESKAFRECEFEEIYFFDNISEISTQSFAGTNFKTFRINAVIAPRYLASNEIVEFAEKMDRLILLQDEKKMIFFAGCTMAYGLNSELVDNAFEEYTIFNMGVIAETSAALQIDIISRFIKEGDVFVHAPEVCSNYQLMYTTEGEARMFLIAEGNFDLISYADMSAIPYALTNFNYFNTSRKELIDGSYSDHTTYYNSYGDINKIRPSTGWDVAFMSGTYIYWLEFVTDSSINRLCDYYDKISLKGGTVYFSFSAVNYHGLTDSCITERTWETFEERYRNGLSKRGYGVISIASDYLLPGRYFIDTDYRLNDDGAKIRTEQLISDLSVILY